MSGHLPKKDRSAKNRLQEIRQENGSPILSKVSGLIIKARHTGKDLVIANTHPVTGRRPQGLPGRRNKRKIAESVKEMCGK